MAPRLPPPSARRSPACSHLGVRPTGHGRCRSDAVGATVGSHFDLPGDAVAGRRARPDRRWLAGRSRGPRPTGQSGASTLGVRSGIDWFELHGQVDFGGVAASPARGARRPLARARRSCAWTMGRTDCCPTSGWRDRCAMATLGEAHDDHVRFQPSQAALIDAWLAEQPQVTWDEPFARLRDELAALRGRHAGRPASHRSRAHCAATSRTRSAGSRSCAASASAGAWPTRWGWARR